MKQLQYENYWMSKLFPLDAYWIGGFVVTRSLSMNGLALQERDSMSQSGSSWMGGLMPVDNYSRTF